MSRRVLGLQHNDRDSLRCLKLLCAKPFCVRSWLSMRHVGPRSTQVKPGLKRRGRYDIY